MGNCMATKNKIRIAQWNILADGLGIDGFVATEFLPIRETSSATSAKYEATQFMELIRQAKEDDTKNGIIEAMNELKKTEKKLKKLKSGSADGDKLKQEISDKKGIVSKSKLVKLKKQFESSPELERINSEILDWNMRYSRIKSLLLRADPDVITFQEIDHVKQFLDDGTFSSKYTCLLEDDAVYQTPFYSDKDDESNDTRRPENYVTELMQSKAAFCPKSYSNAYTFRKKRPRPGSHVDDDGVAIFWKRDKFNPMELGFLQYPTKEGGVKREGSVVVTLKHKASGQLINVLTAHLPSGNEVTKEIERLNVLKDPSAEFTAQRLCRQEKGWKQVPYEADKKFDGLISFVQYYEDRQSSLTIFALDTNSRPTFPLTESSSGEKTNVWNSILQGSTLESVWVQSSLLNEEGKAINQDLPFVASVNKMRGPSSDQPSKIGEHQLELIDHIFTNARNSRLIRDVQVHDVLPVPLAPLQYASKEGKAEISLNPSISMPSDHLPVVVDLEL